MRNDPSIVEASVPAVRQSRRGAIGKAIIVWIATGSFGAAIVAYLAFGAMGC
jgi:hypothetical protein